MLSDLEDRRSLVRDEDAIVFGYRDAEEASGFGSPDGRETAMRIYDLADVQRLGEQEAAARALDPCSPAPKSSPVSGCRLHAGVGDDAVMPAVDYRRPGGLDLAGMSSILRTLMASGKVIRNGNHGVQPCP